MNEAPTIEVTGAVKRFGLVTALAGVSFKARRGEVLGLLGPDGAGKSTLMRLLSGVMSPDEGQISIAGSDVVHNPESAKPHLGYLPQRFALYLDLTVAENLRFCAELFGVRKREYRERADRLLAITRLAPFTERLAGKLSGGMKQKLGLMCALIHTPEVLLLDEPTTGVDPASRRDFWELIHDLPAQGVTVLVSTPYMDEAERCDRLVLLNRGKLLADGTPAELRAAVEGNLFSITVQPQRSARGVLKALEYVQSVIVFGDSLHIATWSDVETSALVDALDQAGLKVAQAEQIEPGLEDAFTAALAREEVDLG